VKSEVNPYLGSVMRAVRSKRPMMPPDRPFLNRVEQVPAGKYMEVWFRTAGCTWDRAGGCTMCNYGHGAPVTAEAITAAVRTALSVLGDRPHELLISPSGGLWDPREVPTEALAPIYAMAAGVGPRRFLVETRAETVTSERVAELRTAFPDTELAVEVGLESAFDSVLTYCVNKGSGSGTFCATAELLQRQGVLTYANVSLGTAFLSRESAVRDAAAAITWALRHGADVAVLFPLHTKPFTLLGLLRRHGRYEPVSLWDVVETVHSLGPQAAARVEIAWYKDYYGTAGRAASPAGCPRCRPFLLDGLDRYRATLNFDVIDHLHARRCSCAGPPMLAAPAQTETQIVEAIVDHYEFLAGALSLQKTWERWRPRLLPAIEEAFTGYAARVSDLHAS
jgi:radical SAM enzyme (TIGR01210 family)